MEGPAAKVPAAQRQLEDQVEGSDGDKKDWKALTVPRSGRPWHIPMVIPSEVDKLYSVRRCGMCYFELNSDVSPVTSFVVRRTLDAYGHEEENEEMHEFDTNLTYQHIHLPFSSRQTTTIGALKASVDRGCHNCGIIYEYIIRTVPDDVTLDDGDSLVWAALKLTLKYQRRNCDKYLVQEFRLFCVGSDLPEHPFVKLGEVPLGDTGSPGSFQYARKLLENCLSSHQACRSRPVTRLPSRVLRIERKGSGSTPHVRLISSHGLAASYACLSYCWGDSRPLCLTTKATLSSNMDNIPWSALPRTFQDAALFICQLGLEYLWIDAICIIQDDEDDWRTQASLMASIYQNCLLTLSANHSSHSGGGLFSRLSIPCQALKSGGTLENPVYIDQAYPHPTNWASGRSLDTGEHFPLSRRAWCYQERLLAPRNIQFLKYELFWECIEQRTCECKVLERVADRWRHNPKNQHWESLQCDTPDNRVLRRWENIVYEYSGLDMSMQKDKLPAISGAARQFGALFPKLLGRYLAGLWEGFLPMTFLWESQGSEETRRSQMGRPKPWRAPSWSWASTNTAVAFRGETLGCKLIRFLEVESITAGADEFGELRSARMLLDGFLIPAVLRYNEPAPYPEYSKGEFNLYYLDERAPFWYRVVIDGDLENAAPVLDDYALCEPGVSCVKDGAKVYCLKTGYERRSDPTYSSSTYYDYAWCIVLRCIDETLNIYERIGTTRTHTGIINDVWFKDIHERTLITLV